LDNIELSLSYARLAAQHDWSVDTLSKKIRDGLMQQTVNAGEEEQPVIQTPEFTRTTIERKNRNHTEIVNTVSLRVAISPIALRILENPYFPLIKP
jgi:hypothetical protein